MTCRRCGTVSDVGARFCARCGTSLAPTSLAAPTDALVGRRLGAGYTLKELLGVGGMGRVYRAEQDALGRTVAVKVIHPYLLHDERTVARFYREARAASRLNHPNSVGVIDFGRADDGVLFLVMEHIEGRDLAAILADEGLLPVPRACRIVEQVLEALIEAHALGIVHRDLKPENILVSRLRAGGDLVKVVDFGLATIIESEEVQPVTLAGTICGTAEYMAPEQIRGAPVDGRADLYGVGVVLFEMLTGSPPFLADSPAKIAFKHLRDPVPNPLEVVPLRKIPPALAALTLEALRKSPADRCQTAEEMLERVRAVSGALGVVAVRCRACGAPAPRRTRYCGACGERLPARTTLDAPPVQATPRLTAYPTLSAASSLVGREDELWVLEEARQRASDAPAWVHLVGEPGIGKTRLLTEVARRAAEDGDLVVGATPHPSRAPVPYAPIRDLMTRLLDVDEADLVRLALPSSGLDDPLARAGIREVTEPVGLEGFEERSRVGAVAAALAAAVHQAQRRSGTGRVLVLLDDLPHCDGLSARVLGHLRGPCPAGVLLLTAGRTGHVPGEWADALSLIGLDDDAARRFLADGPGSLPKEGASGRFLTPLYLEQVQALGLPLDDERLPARVADVIARRLQRLSLEAVRVLQAAAVLGDRCSRGWLDHVLEPLDPDILEGLVGDGLLRRSADTVELGHPFIRDLVLASIPSEARHELHVRALRVAVDGGAPLEVRAEHAFGAGEAIGAMVVLEQMGERALRRGDVDAAVLAFRRALETARRELHETGDLLLEGAIVTFSRKLGVALFRAGEHDRAEGAMREALDLAPPESLERARMLLALAKVTMGRERGRQAERLLRVVLAIATSRGEAEIEAEVYECLASLRQSASDWPAAADHLRKACELYGRSPRTRRRRARSLVELGKVLVEAGERAEGSRLTDEGRQLAEQLGSTALAAMALATMARADVVDGRLERAEALYRDAARLAAEAGDAEWHEQWVRAARTPAA